MTPVFLTMTELYVIGKDAKDNTRIIESSFEYDVWFHVKDQPSPHLIYRNPQMHSLDTLRQTGILYQMAIQLKKHSKCSKENNVVFIYCYIKNLKTTSTPGLVKTIIKPLILKA
jgi:predicted ribosome quality control (RQC) complex YloA/Tae2 family protein